MEVDVPGEVGNSGGLPEVVDRERKLAAPS